MFRAMNGQRKVVVFYIAVLAMALVVALAAPVLGEITPLVTMLTPAVGVILMMTLIAPEGGWGASMTSLGLARPGWRAWPLAILGSSLIIIAVYAVTWMTDIASFKPTNLSAPVLKIAVNLSSGIVISTLLAMCEEVGWRGYMLPRLMGLGVVSAMLVAGFLQGVWHLPVLLFTSYYHAEGNPFLIVPLFLVTLTLAGVFFGYLRFSSDSVWPAAIAPGVFNWTWSLMDELTEVHAPEPFAYVSGESGIIIIAALIIVAGILIRHMRKHPLLLSS